MGDSAYQMVHPLNTRFLIGYRSGCESPIWLDNRAAALAYSVDALASYLLSPLPRLVVGCSVLLGSYVWMLLHVMKQKGFYLELFRELKVRPSDHK